MSRTSLNSKRVVLRRLSFASVVAASSLSARAATLTWDANTGSSGVQDGAGTAATTWWNGSGDVAWDNAANASDTAQFGSSTSTSLGGNYTVTLASNFTMGNLAFTYKPSNNYTLTTSGSNKLTLGGTGGAGSAMVSLNSTSGGIVPTISAALVNSGGLTFASATSFGASQFIVLTNANSGITGSVTVGGGAAGGTDGIVLWAAGSSLDALGSASGVTVNNGSSLRLGSPAIYNNPISLAGIGAGGRGAISLYSNNATITGSITLTSNARIRSDVAGPEYISGAIGESGGSNSLEYYSGSTTSIIVTGTNTYTGGTSIDSSTGTFTFAADKDAAFGATPGSAATNIVFTGAGSTVLQANASYALNANRNILISSASHTFNTNGNNLGIGGVISGSTPITKSGAGTLTLSGSNLFTGALSVTGGTLLVGAAGSINGTSSLVINGGEFRYDNATTAFNKTVTFTAGTISGSGVISSSVTAGASTAINPGDVGIGTLATGTLSMSASTTKYNAEIDTSSVQSDQIVVTGNLTLSNNPILQLTDLGGDIQVTSGQKFVLLTYTGSWNGGTFSGLADGSTFTLGSNNEFTIAYSDSVSGLNAVTLTSVPEPTSVGLLLAFAGIGLRRRRSQ